MRLFIGTKIESDDLGTWRDHLRKLKQSFGRNEIDIRWTPAENYHITLAFLGEQQDDSIKTLSEIIDQTADLHAIIHTNANGMGAFPGIHNARVVWIGVQNKKTLRSLQTDLVERLVSKGFVPPEEGFVPHVTVGRMRNIQSVKAMIDPHVRKSWGELKISELTLFKSEIFGPFPKYTPLYSRELRSRGDKSGDDVIDFL